jgi:hypothetical protein
MDGKSVARGVRICNGRGSSGWRREIKEAAVSGHADESWRVETGLVSLKFYISLCSHG